MPDFPYRNALIVGAGPGISASVARHLAGLGVNVALAARNVEKLDPLIRETGAVGFVADAALLICARRYTLRIMPPSTRITPPVMYDERVPARNATTDANSSASP